MQELSYCADLLYIGRGAADFAGKIDLALKETDQTLPSRRVAFTAANAWASRVSMMDSAICQTFPRVSILIVTYNNAEFIGPCLTLSAATPLIRTMK